MKYSQWIGIAAALILIASCHLPWTYYPDLNKTFNGFFSENNVYGKPGKVFMYLCALSIICFALNRVWAKRVNFFLTAVIVAFAIRTFILYTGCYRGICPDKKEGIWIMAISSLVMLGMSVLPDLKVSNKST